MLASGAGSLSRRVLAGLQTGAGHAKMGWGDRQTLLVASATLVFVFLSHTIADCTTIYDDYESNLRLDTL
jgi:hypothetical protein